MRRDILTVAFAGALLLCGLAAEAQDISGVGATLPDFLYWAWAREYRAHTGRQVSYDGIGSGGGIKQIKEKFVVFSGTDVPLSEAELRKSRLIQFPMAMSAVVPVVNLTGIKSDELVLDASTLAKIFAGEIRSWDDPDIQHLNPNLKLPHQQIAVVHRYGASGTTFIFTSYLADVDKTWAAIGGNAWIDWPLGTGARGNEGVARMVSQIDGSISYMAYPHAEQDHIAFVRLVNKDGRVVSPNTGSFVAAAANVGWQGAPTFRVILNNRPGALSWPIFGASYILMADQPSDSAAARKALEFFHWAYMSGGNTAAALGYVPVPNSVASEVELMWQADIRGAGGGQIWQPGVVHK
jgi:phosphate transport system substrate-binding protein